ncbi:MAG: tRNA-dihydrouridine synthase [Clostridia bacterium]|nr:tRNA-dihydrouridine synthase [Clostridia bacterium]
MLAPMAGMTDDVMRLLCGEYGCGMAVSEMVSAKGLLMGEKSCELLSVLPGEPPLAVQIFGHEPEVMAQAARFVCQYRAHICAIDINFGCPAHKIVRNGEGSALLNNLPLLGRIVGAVVKASDKPVTVKIRKGFRQGDNIAAQAARIVRDEGAAMLTVHGRTTEQGYSGKADWAAIAEAKQAVGSSLIVIGNGDITDSRSARACRAQTGCDGVMIGRAAIGAPWVFADRVPDYKERCAVAERHLRLEIEKMGERFALPFMRKHLVAYVKGLKGAAKARGILMQQINAEAVIAALHNVFSQEEAELNEQQRS